MVEEASDRLGRWFARYADDRTETFSARLLNGSDELGIAWTDDVTQLVGNIAEVQGAIGRNKFGINNYGARSEHRAGIILERGRQRWEVRLSQDDVRLLSAFVACFSSAGNAVNSWLMGCELKEVLDSLNDQLVVPPGLTESYTIYESRER